MSPSVTFRGWEGAMLVDHTKAGHTEEARKIRKTTNPTTTEQLPYGTTLFLHPHAEFELVYKEGLGGQSLDKITILANEFAHCDAYKTQEGQWSKHDQLKIIEN